MEFSEWFASYVKPELNGVYQRRNPDDPKSPITYSLYRRGWHVDCATPEEAAVVIEMASWSSLTNGSPRLKTFIIGKDRMPSREWRGLAKQPPGMKAEFSDKYSRI